ncbi:MAG: SAM-dependent methyltransferase [Pseudomonadota bacterium]
MSDSLLPPRRPTPSTLPEPDESAMAVSAQLTRQIQQAMEQAGGRIPFDSFMELALYAPGLGYYLAGSRKFGEAGDFVTAPEISPLFAQCLARQAREVLGALDGGEILEFGAGSGVLAADMLLELERLDALPARYLIMELSPELKERQQRTLAQRVPELLSRVVWLEHLPREFRGLVVANELLDAMPVSRFRVTAGGIEECFVEQDEEGLKEAFAAPQTPGLAKAVERLESAVGGLAEGYVSEINLRQSSWLRALAGMMDSGAVLLIDYGYPRNEYYHPQRSTGTLMCHYRHRAHPDPFRWVGLQDITTHVDFSALVEVAVEAGFDLAGYTTQAHFLMASGLDELVAASDPEDLTKHMELVQGVKRLTLPSEMGERFKVIGLMKTMEINLAGFNRFNLQSRL